MIEQQEGRFAVEHDAELLLLAFLVALPIHAVVSWRWPPVSQAGRS